MGSLRQENDATFKIFRKYQTGRIGDATFFNGIYTYLHRIAHGQATKAGIRQSLQHDEAVQHCVVKIWDAIKSGRLPDRSVKEARAYIIAVIHSEARIYAGGERHREEFPPHVMHGLCSRTNENIEDRIFLTELPELLRAGVRRRMVSRFPEIDVRATEYTMDRLLNGEYISGHWLDKNYRARDPAFFVESVMISLRLEARSLSGEASPVKSLLRETLYESYIQ